jgi:hypothetical protein
MGFLAFQEQVCGKGDYDWFQMQSVVAIAHPLSAVLFLCPGGSFPGR